MGGGNLFTGIVEEIGKIAGIQKGAKSAVLTIQAEKVLEDVHIGDSIAVNGVCLTVTSLKKYLHRRCDERNSATKLTRKPECRQQCELRAGNGSKRAVWRSYRVGTY